MFHVNIIHAVLFTMRSDLRVISRRTEIVIERKCFVMYMLSLNIQGYIVLE